MAKPGKKHIIDIDEDRQIALDVDPAEVEFIIQRARIFDAKTPPVEPNPGGDPIDDDEREILEDYPSDKTETELRDAIGQLSDDAKLDLVAMLWVGRGEFGPEEWEEARAVAAERATLDTAAYLMGEPQLADFLEEGLAALGYEPEA